MSAFDPKRTSNPSGGTPSYGFAVRIRGSLEFDSDHMKGK
jgi:hypothetical protein